MTLLPKRIRPKDWVPIGVGEIEPNAMEVVQSTNNRVVIAGPGAGKTELLAQRAAYLLQTGSAPAPRRILAISFKRDSATNLATRVRKRCRGSQGSRFHSMTFDAFAKGLVDRFGQVLPDRWRPRSDYEIMLTNKKLYRGFLQQHVGALPAEIGIRADIESITPKEFEHQHLFGSRLPSSAASEERINPTPAQWAADRFWQLFLHEKTNTHLSFEMIGRLAGLIVSINPMIRSALQLTYSHLFLDEFQDTTQVQYDFVHDVFLQSNTVITAVGDNKQQIMRWAMAMDNPFSTFEIDFDAHRTLLYNNYRSSPKLVKIQHVLAQALDREVVESVSKTSTTIMKNQCAVWNFQTPEIEAEQLAAFVARQMKARSLQPQDFAILVRQTAAGYTKILEPAFKKKKIPLRNETDKIHDVVLQNLLTERLSKLLVMILRIAMTPPAWHCWSECQKALSAIRGISLNDERMHVVLAQKLHEFSIYLRTRYPSPPNADFFTAHALVDCVLNFIDRDKLAAAHPAYAQGSWFENVAEAAAVHLHASSIEATNWTEAIDAYEGLHAIPLMTIHKSKGLEYHTVIFVGLDDDAWWSFSDDKIENIASFFVAFSRAKQHVIFTYCANRGARTIIKPLYNLLKQASVSVYNYSPADNRMLLDG